MVDAFGAELFLGDNVLYSTNSSAGTFYAIGKIIKFYPCNIDPLRSYSPPDRVSVQIQKSNTSWNPQKNPIVYSSNVVKLS